MSKAMRLFTGTLLLLACSLPSTVNGAVVVSNSSEGLTAITARAGSSRIILLRVSAAHLKMSPNMPFISGRIRPIHWWRGT